MASRQAWKDGTPNRVQMASIPHCIWRGIRSSGTPVTSSGRMSPCHAVDVGPDPRLHVPAHVDHGRIGHQRPDPEVGGRPTGRRSTSRSSGRPAPPGRRRPRRGPRRRRAPRRAAPRSRAGTSWPGWSACSRAGPGPSKTTTFHPRSAPGTPSWKYSSSALESKPPDADQRGPRVRAGRPPAAAPGSPGAMPPSKGTSSALDRRVEQRRRLGEAGLAPGPGVATAGPAPP